MSWERALWWRQQWWRWGKRKRMKPIWDTHDPMLECSLKCFNLSLLLKSWFSHMRMPSSFLMFSSLFLPLLLVRHILSHMTWVTTGINATFTRRCSLTRTRGCNSTDAVGLLLYIPSVHYLMTIHECLSNRFYGKNRWVCCQHTLWYRAFYTNT